MSQEWLKKLAELSNDKDLVKRAERLQRKAAQRARARQQPSAAAPRRSLLGAAFGHFFRFLFLIGLAQAAAMFVVAVAEGLEGEPWGMIFHYLVWDVLTQPIFPPAFYDLLRDGIGLTPADLGAVYVWINETIEIHQDVLVYAVPVAAALALTLFFLPSINAGRRRSPIRVLVYLANLAILVFLRAIGPGAVVVWLAAFVFSFAGGGTGRVSRPAPSPAPAQPERVARPVPASRPAASAGGTVERAARPAVVARREPTVTRRGDAPSWIRAR
ncbi:MAG: hypothetical protein AB7S71_08815 [Dongiaceae bacterium]